MHACPGGISLRKEVPNCATKSRRLSYSRNRTRLLSCIANKRRFVHNRTSRCGYPSSQSSSVAIRLSRQTSLATTVCALIDLAFLLYNRVALPLDFACSSPSEQVFARRYCFFFVIRMRFYFSISLREISRS